MKQFVWSLSMYDDYPEILLCRIRLPERPSFIPQPTENPKEWGLHDHEGWVVERKHYHELGIEPGYDTPEFWIELRVAVESDH